MQRCNATAVPVPGARRCRMRGVGEDLHGHDFHDFFPRLQPASVGGWPRLPDFPPDICRWVATTSLLSPPPEVLRDGHASVPVHLTIAGLDKGPSPRVGGRMNAMRKHIVGTMTHFSAE